jgi:mannose-6-phosphate isomerase-like protein (cupin superfamily)
LGTDILSRKSSYSIKLDAKYRHLEVIDVPAIAAGCSERWFNQTLTRVNDSVVRLGIVQGEFHWHKHDKDDEFSFVLRGRLLNDIEGRTIELSELQGVTVPRGVLHRPRAPEKTMMLMVETQAVVPIGDSQA